MAKLFTLGWILLLELVALMLFATYTFLWNVIGIERSIQFPQFILATIPCLIPLYVYKQSRLNRVRDYLVGEIKDIQEGINTLISYARENNFPVEQTKQLFANIDLDFKLLNEDFRMRKYFKWALIDNKMYIELLQTQLLIFSTPVVSNDHITLESSVKNDVEKHLYHIKKGLKKIMGQIDTA